MTGLGNNWKMIATVTVAHLNWSLSEYDSLLASGSVAKGVAMCTFITVGQYGKTIR